MIKTPKDDQPQSATNVRYVTQSGTSKAVDIDALKAAIRSLPNAPAKNRTSKIGILREMYQDICTMIDKGWRHSDIVRLLNEKGGMNITLGTFRTYLYGMDVEFGRGTAQFEPHAAQQPIAGLPKPQQPPIREQPPQTAKPTPQPTSEEHETNDSGWDNLTKLVKMPTEDDKGFMQMPGEKPKD